MRLFRSIALFAALSALSACQTNDLKEPPVPLGDFALGLNIAVADKVEMVPIQEDETALVLWALWKNFEEYHDIELIRELYHTLVVPCAEFMADFRDTATKLPQASWNLWEDRRGVHTFTCATVVAGLRAAANMARLFGDDEKAAIYEKAANEIVTAMAEHLYNPTLGRFIRSLQSNSDDSLTPDPTVDASLLTQRPASSANQ